MPICDNNKNKPSPIAVVDVDHEAEIAKAKISREQAYFNSYDFDAIEVVPLDEDEEADPNCDSIKQTPDAGDDGSDLGHQVPSGVYLKRLTSYFTAATRIRHLNKIHQTSPSTSTSTATTPGDTVVGGEDSQSNSSSSSSRNSSRKLYKACGDDTANHGARNNFSLPRAMLKYQSALAASSMSAAGLATCTTSISKVTTAIASTKPTNNRLIYGNQKSPGNVRNSGFVQCYGKSGDRERVISASHYSTDKSGSSGYYSSNVCSTSSVEEHIYSEPVVDIIETRLAPLKQLTLPLQGIARVAEGQSYYNVEIHDSKITEELQLLETSIENLDRHLKSYPRLNSPSPSPKPSSCTVYDEVHSVQNYDKIKSSRPMPTIMEGIDAQSPAKTPASWTEEMDDSLMDIDLDSFLLVNEVGTKPTKAKKTLAGIDNPTFNKTKVLHEEVLENNYKCSKYVNSCPEDAYKVESVIETVAPGSGKEPPDKSLAFFLKKYEDQIHFQNTKDMLEDIRTKVISLTNNSSGDSPAGGHQQLPKDLEKHIAILKLELEAYLRLMNYSNELEIKRLCTGLVNDQKLMTITKAFERRRSLTSDYELAYEPLRASSYTTLPYGTAGRDDSGSIACSDPNFQLKRKPITEGSSTNRSSHHYPTVVNDDEFGDDGGVEKDIIVDNGGNSDGKTVLNVTQLQRNLSFQRPILDIRSKGDDDKDKMLECHTNKPSIWELYYGTNRIHQKLAGQRGHLVKNSSSILSYPSSRPESDFTLDLPKAEQLRLKMEKEKKFRQRCRILTTFLSLVFFLLTVMVVSLILTRGKRMFGSML